MERLLIYVTQLKPTGGIESHILEFCEKMADDGVSMDILVPHFAMNYQDELRIKNACSRVLLYRGKRGIWRFFWLFFNAAFLSLKKYHTLYTNGQGESIKIIAHLVRPEHWVHHHHTSGDSTDQKTWGKNYLKTLYAANSIIACSNKNASDMMRVINRNIQVIPCFSRKINIGSSLPKKNKPIRFGYYGRLIPEKGIDIICHLSEDPDLKEIEFHLWGEGKFYPALFFENFPNVTYHGMFSKPEELENVLKSIDAFLLLSIHSEGLPISLLEVMSAGIPWLAKNRGGIPDIACDPLSTRVIPADSTYEQIKDALQLFAEDIAKGKVLKGIQERLYLKNFSAPVLVNKWTKVLKLNH